MNEQISMCMRKLESITMWSLEGDGRLWDLFNSCFTLFWIAHD